MLSNPQEFTCALVSKSGPTESGVKGYKMGNNTEMRNYVMNIVRFV